MPKHPSEDSPELEQALKGFDEAKRRTLTKLALGAAFVTPVVASFSMDGLTISRVHAESANGSGLVKDDEDKDKHHMHPNSTHMNPNSTHPNSS
jgi:hypothetical protein